MRRVWKWTKRIVIGTVVVVGLAIGVVLMIAHTDWGRDFIRRRAEAALLENFPGGVRIGRITGSVFGTLVVEDVVINNRDGKPWVTIGSAKVQLSLLPLVRKIARIDAVEVDDVVVDQHPQPERPDEAPPPGEPSPWTIEIPAVAVHRGRVAIVTKTRTFDVQHVEAMASLSIGDGAVMIVTGLDGSWQGKPIHASAALRFADGHVNAPYMQVAMEGAEGADLLAFGAQLKPKLAGIVRAQLPAATMKAIAGVKLPGDAAAVVFANENKLDATVTMANATARALVVVDVTALSVEGFVVAQVPDGARLDPRFAGAGIVTASFDANLAHARGIVTLDGVRPVDPGMVGRPQIRGKTFVAIDGTLAGAWVYVEGALDIGGARVTGFATASRDKTTGAIALQKSTLVATARKVGAPKTDLSVGYIAANARATGEVWPKQSLKISGSAGGENVRYTTYRSETVDVRFDLAKQLAGHLDATGVYKGARLLGSASFDAHGTTTGDVTSIDVDSHTITTAANGVWSGNGGHVEISPLNVIVQHLHTGNGGGTATADVTFARDTKDLTATVDAKQVVLATVAPDIKGTVGGHAVVARTGGRWSGNGHLVATQLTIPKRPPADVDATFKVEGRRVTVKAKTTAEAGVVTLAADVEGPYDPTDMAAWLRLDRRALHDANLEVAHLDTTKLGIPKLTGTVAGTLDVTATQASGTLHVQGVQTSRGAIAADLSLEPGTKSVTAKLAATFGELGGATVTADLAFPDHIFDPDAWQQKGKHVLAHALVAVPAVSVDPNLLARLNVTAPYSGRVEASAEIAEAAATATATIDVHGAQGGAIKQPIDVHVDAGIDNRAHATLTATSGAVTLAVVDVHVPFDLDHVTDVRTAKLDGSVTFPKASAKDLIAIFGRGDATAGTVDGAVTIAGTVDAPTADGKITAENVTIKPTIAGRASQKLAKLVVKGGWTGTAGHLDITGNETSVTKGVPDGMLHITAQGRPDQLAALTASVESANFDVAPFTAFFSGAVGAARGTINASLNLKGFDPNTGDLHGTLQLRNGRFPLSALLGTLRSIDADVTVDNHDVKLTNLDAKLGKGTLHGTGHLALVGSTPSKAHVDLAIKQVSLVRAFQPTIDAQVAGDFIAGAQWTGDVTVSRGHVTIATTGGVKLLDASVPNDIIFIDVAQSAIRPLSQRPPPSRPWLIADVTIKPTALDVIQDEFQVRGDASGKLTVSLGQDSIGVDGSIEAERGDIDLLGARSLLDHANVVFDGSIDPLLDVRVIRDLDSLTVTADITGRASAWELHMSSDSGSYTQSELYSFFVGGQPASSRGDAGQAAAAAGAGVASALITKKLNKLFGTNLAFNYETATATSSDAIRIGYWYNRRTFIAARAHYEARIDENAEEGFVEYHFKSNWLLQINAGDRNYDGLDFVHRWHW